MPLEQRLAQSEHSEVLAVIIILTYLRVIIFSLVYQNRGQHVIDGLLRGVCKMHPIVMR